MAEPLTGRRSPPGQRLLQNWNEKAIMAKLPDGGGWPQMSPAIRACSTGMNPGPACVSAGTRLHCQSLNAKAAAGAA